MRTSPSAPGLADSASSESVRECAVVDTEHCCNSVEYPRCIQRADEWEECTRRICKARDAATGITRADVAADECSAGGSEGDDDVVTRIHSECCACIVATPRTENSHSPRDAIARTEHGGEQHVVAECTSEEITVVRVGDGVEISRTRGVRPVSGEISEIVRP
ncbi:MAG: hypothetical protein RIS71_436, partial [Actinomycetota bacterium]